MRRIWHRLKTEPAMLFALVEAAVALGVAFGADLTGEQAAAVLGLVAVVTGAGTRQRVTPKRKPNGSAP